MEIPTTVRAERFSRRIVIHEEPQIAERIGALAVATATSSAAIVRFAIREFLRKYDEPTIR